MSVYVLCGACGRPHESRFRARSEPDFDRLNPEIGAVLEACPHCGARDFAGPGERDWREPTGRALAAV